jgi:hypothetical protein
VMHLSRKWVDSLSPATEAAAEGARDPRQSLLVSSPVGEETGGVSIGVRNLLPRVHYRSARCSSVSEE